MEAKALVRVYGQRDCAADGQRRSWRLYSDIKAGEAGCSHSIQWEGMLAAQQIKAVPLVVLVTAGTLTILMIRRAEADGDHESHIRDRSTSSCMRRSVGLRRPCPRPLARPLQAPPLTASPAATSRSSPPYATRSRASQRRRRTRTAPWRPCGRCRCCASRRRPRPEAVATPLNAAPAGAQRRKGREPRSEFATFGA